MRPAAAPFRGPHSELLMDVNDERTYQEQGFNQAAKALATAATAPTMAAPTTIRARIFSSRPRLKPAVLAVYELREETRSSWYHPLLNLESARQLSLSRIKAPSSCAVPSESARWHAFAKSDAGSSILILCLGDRSCSLSGAIPWVISLHLSLTGSGFSRSWSMPSRMTSLIDFWPRPFAQCVHAASDICHFRIVVSFELNLPANTALPLQSFRIKTT